MATTPFSVIKFRYVFSACWILWIGLHASVLYWYGFSATAAMLDSIVCNVLLAVFCVLISNTFRYYLPTRERYGYLLALCSFITVVWFFISRFLLFLLQDNANDYNHFFAASVPVRIGIAFLITGCMVLLSVLWYTLQDQQQNEKRKAEAERLAREAELGTLRQQLQPHFLFNSLNSINALIGFQPGQARHMIQQLSDFLRGTLKKEDNLLVTLREELSHLQLYLDIEKVRFGHRLSAIIESSEAADQMKLPAMMLQPVVENAIKFGLYDTTESVTISIQASAKERVLVITVTNPYDEATAPSGKGTGFGLSSVQRRLYLVFAQHDLLQTHAENNLFTTTITIPQTS